MSFSADLNGVRVLRARLVTCRRGPWFADVDLDPDSAPVTLTDVPSGAVVLTISPPGGTPIVLRGTVDPSASGRFVSGVPVRVLAGGGGWSTTVPAQHFHSDGGLSTLTVEQATAAACGETVVDASPLGLGIDWDRLEGPARRVFGDRDWYVDPSGVTQVASRPSASQDPSVEVLEWDPTQARAILSADVLVLPGTVLTDARFDGPLTVQDVSQTFSPEGTRAEVWCGSSSSSSGRMLSVLTNLVRELGGLANLRQYRYRIVSQGADGRLTLQAVPNSDGTPSDAPPLQPVSVFPGMAGLSALYKLSSHVIVALLNGDPGQPVVVGFDGSLPLGLTLDTTGVLALGPSASSVAIAGGGAGAARGGDVAVGMLPPNIPVSGMVTIGGTPSSFTGTMVVTQPIVAVIETFSSLVGVGG